MVPISFTSEILRCSCDSFYKLRCQRIAHQYGRIAYDFAWERLWSLETVYRGSSRGGEIATCTEVSFLDVKTDVKLETRKPAFHLLCVAAKRLIDGSSDTTRQSNLCLIA